MKKIYLSSVGMFIISIIGTCSMLLLTILVFLADNTNFFGQLASILVLIFFMFVLYLCFFEKIILKEKNIIIWKFKRILIPYSSIIKIYTNDNVLENIIYIETEQITYKISGKSTILGKKKNKKETQKIIKKLNYIIGCK
ncbi:MAG: hypothetical protein ACI35W_03730 [Anaeroplasmataceae bacterium]